MNYKLYRVNLRKKSVVDHDEMLALPEDIDHSLSIIEEEIIKEYLKKQDGKTGIKSLGQEIRYNDKIDIQFNEVKSSGNVLIKLTENKRSFLHVFIEALYSFNSNDIYFLILEKEFGKRSRLVDSTFIDLNHVIHELDSFFNFFKIKKENINIHFVELTGFENFSVVSEGKYSKIYSK